MAEWSKALHLRCTLFGGVGSNPTVSKLLPGNATTYMTTTSIALDYLNSTLGPLGRPASFQVLCCVREEMKNYSRPRLVTVYLSWMTRRRTTVEGLFTNCFQHVLVFCYQYSLDNMGKYSSEIHERGQFRQVREETNN
jgi:hypothetical protein